jgi:hypothetical protein
MSCNRPGLHRAFFNGHRLVGRRPAAPALKPDGVKTAAGRANFNPERNIGSQGDVYTDESWWRAAMNHRGVEYTITATSVPGVWKWQFRIGDEVKAGKTETRISLLAIRRVQLRIDRELKRIASQAG